jgi:hypothetical protein
MRTRSRLGISAFLLVLLSALPASVENPGPLRLEKEIPSSRVEGRLGAGDKAAVIGGQKDDGFGGAGKGTSGWFRGAVNAEGFDAARAVLDGGSPILQQGKLAASTIRIRRRPENYNRANILR